MHGLMDQWDTGLVVGIHGWMVGWILYFPVCVSIPFLMDRNVIWIALKFLSQSVSQSVSLTEKKINLYRYFEVIS